MENVYTTVKPFYNLSKVLCLFPLTFDGPPRKGCFTKKWHDGLTPLVVPGIAILLIALNLVVGDGPSSSSSLLNLIWKIHAAFGCLLIILQFAWQMNNLRLITKFLNELNNYDQKVKDNFIIYNKSLRNEL